METECAEQTKNVKEELQQANTKIKKQEEEIKKLQTKLLKATQESEQLMNKKENELKVNILSIIITGKIPID